MNKSFEQLRNEIAEIGIIEKEDFRQKNGKDFIIYLTESGEYSDWIKAEKSMIETVSGYPWTQEEKDEEIEKMESNIANLEERKEKYGRTKAEADALYEQITGTDSWNRFLHGIGDGWNCGLDATNNHWIIRVRKVM